MARKHNVRRTWQIAPVQSKAIAQRMKPPPDAQFWLGVLLSNRPHCPGAYSRDWRISVRHQASYTPHAASRAGAWGAQKFAPSTKFSRTVLGYFSGSNPIVLQFKIALVPTDHTGKPEYYIPAVRLAS